MAKRKKTLLIDEALEYAHIIRNLKDQLGEKNDTIADLVHEIRCMVPMLSSAIPLMKGETQKMIMRERDRIEKLIRQIATKKKRRGKV